MPKPRKTRHHKPAAERKTVVIPVRCTPEQQKRWTELAAKQGCAVSHWLREVGDRRARELDDLEVMNGRK